ncbi:hypothetical protein [Lichenifustis flavocetrariae]|uniref:Uncharacterized protein n=1 Tax=Lichenifustis flavocetrariae TaxID=2949735 RepID=A0AA42CM22_9HYPH|nr:hypothetical protein [Lichenifustis flavocetrariae]MCW6507967.1 hypothetical protein [Lichenifustis flavocetrariae]
MSDLYLTSGFHEIEPLLDAIETRAHPADVCGLVGDGRMKYNRFPDVWSHTRYRDIQEMGGSRRSAPMRPIVVKTLVPTTRLAYRGHVVYLQPLGGGDQS